MSEGPATASAEHAVPEERWARSCSVVLVSYHTGPVLLDCLASVLAERDVREVILVDNGNDSETISAVNSLDDPRVQVISGHGNVGFARGCNIGAAQAAGATLLLLNPDTVLEPGALATALNVLGERPDIGLATVRLLNQDGTEQRGARRNVLTPLNCLVEQLRLDRLVPGLPRVNLHTEPVPDRPVEVECISGAFMLVQRPAYRKLGGMDEGYFLHVEDIDFCLRAGRSGHGILYIPQAAVRHVRGTSRASPAMVEWHKARGVSRYFLTHFRSSHPFPLLLLLVVLAHARFLALAPLLVLRRWLRGAS